MNEEKKYIEVEVRVTFITPLEIPEEIAHDADLVEEYAHQYGSTPEALSTGDVEIDILNSMFEEDGHVYTVSGM